MLVFYILFIKINHTVSSCSTTAYLLKYHTPNLNTDKESSTQARQTTKVTAYSKIKLSGTIVNETSFDEAGMIANYSLLYLSLMNGFICDLSCHQITGD